MEWGSHKTTQKLSNKYEQTTEHVKQAQKLVQVDALEILCNTL